MNPRVKAVLRKEFREYRRNRMIVLTMGALPAVFLVLPLVQSLLIPDDGPQGMYAAAAGQALLLFLIVPLMIPSTVAAYSVIGEREQGTIEPVLTTPVEDTELLAGKALAAAIPAALVAWALFGIFMLVILLFGSDRMADAMWATQPQGALVLVPALAGFSTVVSLAISVRSRDIRVAQQLAGLATLPAFGVIAVFSFGLVDPTMSVLVGAAAAIAAVDVAGWRVVAAMFDRERLLTRLGS
jgi:ABC-type Na+ efflux pump permease subunit